MCVVCVKEPESEKESVCERDCVWCEWVCDRTERKCVCVCDIERERERG